MDFLKRVHEKGRHGITEAVFDEKQTTMVANIGLYYCH